MRLRLAALAAVVPLLTGCSSGPPSDPPAVAVSEARSAVASVTLAVELKLGERTTSAYTQVVLQTGRDTVADAQHELATADDLDGSRRAVAEPVVVRASSALSELAVSGASALTPTDLQRLRALDRELARAAEALGR